MFIPSEEKQVPKPSFVGKFFSTKEKQRQPDKPAAQENQTSSVFKMQEETSKPLPSSPPPTPPRARPATPPVRQPAPPPAKKFSPPPKNIPSVKSRLGGITLIPEEEVSPEEAAKPRERAILIAVGVILILVGGCAFGTLRWYKNQIDAKTYAVSQDVESVNGQIKNLNEPRNRAETLRKQFDVAGKLLNRHVYWTPVFSLLEKNTIPDVYFKNFTASSDGQMDLSGVAKNYEAVAEQIVSLREAENVSAVYVSGASASLAPTGETSEVDFEAKIKLGQNLFVK